MAKQKRKGRPEVPKKKQAKSHGVSCRPEQRNKWKELAAAEGLGPSAWAVKMMGL